MSTMNMDPQEHKNSFSSEPQNHFEPVNVTLDEVLKNHTHEKSINLSGSDSLFSLAFFLTQSSSPIVKNQTNLVILPDQKSVEKFTKEVLFFNPDARVFALQEYDMNVYSGLYPSKKIVSRRVSWCYRAQNAKKSDIFVTSITGALQKTLPVDTLFDNSFHFQKDSDWEPGFLEHLQEIGYLSTPLVEDVGQVAVRGGIIDIFSPAHKWPIRLELFGNTIESLRFFDPETQRTIKECSSLVVIPPREVVLNKKLRQPTAIAFTNDLKTREVEQNEQSRSFLRDLSKGHYFQEIDYFLPYLYDQPTLPLNHFFNDYRCWHFKPQEITANADNLTKELKDSYISSQQNPLCPRPELIFANLDSFKKNITQSVYFDKVILHEHENDLDFEFRVHSLQEFQKQSAVFIKQPHEHKEFIKQKLHDWMRDSAIFISCQTEHQSQKIKSLLDDLDIKSQIVESHHYEWHTWKDLKNQNSILILPRGSFESMRIPSEQLVFLRDDDFFGHKSHNLKKNTHKSFTQSVSALNFGDLKSGDYVVHKQHGVGIYQNLTLMGIQGVDAEFIQIQYKGNDKLYLPVYRIGQIQKYSGPKNPQFIDKLGGTGWQKTQTKVKAHLRDLASELLNLYAKRSQTIRPPLSDPDSDYYAFENSFPFDETNDQL
ncbi:MAG: hypothetical protein KDD50_06055, partial [Bdellovibrionales bacterium]|nr:hypothetical protein [Bdellovibrionales bacterium]